MTPVPNLPVSAPEPAGPGGVPLSQTPTAALCFALGYVTARPVDANQWGGFCALVEELMRRDKWSTVTASLPPELVRSIMMLYTAHRGQRWAHTGRRTAR